VLKHISVRCYPICRRHCRVLRFQGSPTCPCDECSVMKWAWNIGGVILSRENRCSGRKTYASATVSTTNLIWTGQGSNQIFRGERPAVRSLPLVLYHWLFILGPSSSFGVALCTTNFKIRKFSFCQHIVFACFVWSSEQTAIISLYIINWLVLIPDI